LRVGHLLSDTGGRRRYFSAHLPLFRRYTEWLNATKVRVNGGQQGWRSEHIVSEGTVHLWQTSQVLLYLLQYTAMLQRHIAAQLLRAAGLSPEAPGRKEFRQPPPESPPLDQVTPSAYWQGRVCREEPIKGLDEASNYRVYQRILDAYVRPREPEAAGQPAYSMLLYGPPGTGKSTIAKGIAQALKYRFLTITPGDFITGGEEEVESKVKGVFDALGEQAETIVLFDEIDRLLLDRDSYGYSQQSDIFQFMTPGMLTKIKDLHETKGVLFVVATNYAERIDNAIKRAGRIDNQYLVLPPDLAARQIILGELLFGTAEAPKAGAEKHIKELTERTALYVYTELKAAVERACRGRSQLDEPLKKEEWDKLSEELTPGKQSIRILSYASRFKGVPGGPEEEKAWYNDEPFEEFFLVVYLALEARGKLREDQQRLYEAVAARATKLDGAPLARVCDDDVRAKLQEALPKGK
jgi:SpoVK/Ycf46/Vps4 family AAA+-type ATPase